MANKKNSGFGDSVSDDALNGDIGADEKDAGSDGENDDAEELENPDSWELEEDVEE
ncbi:MAG: hypothetical protein HYW15_00480 [Candidatus Giovannonibacteria bacterium]|nr:MAG: hypothetical protein HYW15_00480 [Candidatus Giovannonibacteria bacterium]